jgi:hypothetical protein
MNRPTIVAMLLVGAMMDSALAIDTEIGFTVSVCYSEVPNSSCSPLESYYRRPLLFGPVPDSTSRAPEVVRDRTYYFQFDDVPPGNYILRENECNPFGCWLDTLVTVVDADIQILVRQIGSQLPRATPIPASICVGDRDDDGRVAVDELVNAVDNALRGCPK